MQFKSLIGDNSFAAKDESLAADNDAHKSNFD